MAAALAVGGGAGVGTCGAPGHDEEREKAIGLAAVVDLGPPSDGIRLGGFDVAAGSSTTCWVRMRPVLDVAEEASCYSLRLGGSWGGRLVQSRWPPSVAIHIVLHCRVVVRMSMVSGHKTHRPHPPLCLPCLPKSLDVHCREVWPSRAGHLGRLGPCSSRRRHRLTFNRDRS